MSPKISATLVVIVASLAVSARAQADDGAAQALPLTMSLQEAKGGADFIDLGALEVGITGGILAFSSDFESDPKFGGGLTLRAPLPWFSRDVLGFDLDAMGLFAQVIISSIDRDFDQPLADPKGTAVYATLGLDYTFLKEEGFRLQGQLGLQYASFGSVTDTDNGVGLLLGVAGSYEVSQGMWITLNPQVSFGGGDMIFFGLLGMEISF